MTNNLNSTSVEWKKELFEFIEKKVDALIVEWDEMGIKDERLAQRRESALNHLGYLLNDMVKEEISSKDNLIELIASREELIAQLSAELELTESVERGMATMVEWECSLHTQLESLQKMQTDRVEELQTFRARERTLCERLGELVVPLDMCTRIVPTKAELAAVCDHISQLTEMTTSRLSQFAESRDRCLDLCALLETPGGDSPLAASVFHPDALSICPLTRSFLADVTRWEAQLTSQCREVQLECSSLLARLNVLWDRLEVASSERQAFKASLERKLENSPSQLHLLRCEVDRREAEKRANLGKFIEACRNELLHWWDTCFVDTVGRDFPPFTDPNCSEEVLSQHEAEINRWKQHYTDHEALFKAVTQWNLKFAQIRDVERKMRDPSILKNRGGVLLKVEKEHKQLSAALSRLQSDLMRLSTESVSSSTVLLDGVSVDAYIQEYWRQLEEEKENEKKQRLDKATKLKEVEARFGSKPALKRGPLAASKTDLHTSIRPAKMYKPNDVTQYNSPAVKACRTPLGHHLPTPSVTSSSKQMTPSHLTGRLFRSPAPKLASHQQKSGSSTHTMMSRRRSKSLDPVTKPPRLALDLSVVTEGDSCPISKLASDETSSTYSDFSRGISGHPTKVHCHSSPAGDSGVAMR